ncbi:3'-5' exoribonuclease 1-like [Tachypleus tridentatus]|uniref:3'-5' exoribonuclease 1-like n=1 Tax=Tachypleus tridentatus TaxID=6853 RepID=UPI003FD0B1A9
MAEKKEKSPFSDPIYKQLSQLNGKINRMGKSEVQAKLKELRLDSRGEVDVLKRRLKNFYKQQKLKKQETEKQLKDARCPYNFLCVIDFEATCEGEKVPDYPHEIIEFPAVLVDTRQKAIVDTFHEYCKPSLNPQLSEFCRSLTGISQETIDGADTFPEVLQKFENWLKDRGLGSDYSFCIATDGPWDMGRFLHLQCQFCKIPFPRWGRKWVNIRKAYTNFYRTKSYSLVPMLELLGLKFEGQQHCGFDDARNIARIAICMLKDGAHLKVNERIDWNSLTKKGESESKDSDTSESSNAVTAALSDITQDGINEDANNATKSSDLTLEQVLTELENLGVDPDIQGCESVLLTHRLQQPKDEESV